MNACFSTSWNSWSVIEEISGFVLPAPSIQNRVVRGRISMPIVRSHGLRLGTFRPEETSSRVRGEQISHDVQLTDEKQCRQRRRIIGSISARSAESALDTLHLPAGPDAPGTEDRRVRRFRALVTRTNLAFWPILSIAPASRLSLSTDRSGAAICMISQIFLR
jgi:hypothetical protein